MREFLSLITLLALPAGIILLVLLALALIFFALWAALFFILPVAIIAFIFLYFTRKKSINYQNRFTMIKFKK